MRKSNGITMASLVVVIAAIILISSMAIGFGYRYITETRKRNNEAFEEVLSSAVIKRERNNSVNSIENPRLGYAIKNADTFKQIVTKYAPSLGANTDLLYERGLWYIIDSNYAGRLGVRNSSDYIDVLDLDNHDEMTFALADYLSGTVVLFHMNQQGVNDIQSGIESSQIEPTDGHVHDYNISESTCTEDKKCLICGYVAQVAKGHRYSGDMPATPIDAEFHYCKICEVCGMGGGYERHSDLDRFAFYKSGDGTWYHYNGCSVCGWPNSDDKSNYYPCTTYYESVSEEQHQLKCRICEHTELFDHRLKYNYLDDTYHEYVCEDCGYYRAKFEPHEDLDHDDLCDKCGHEMIENEYPVLESVIIKNKEYPDSHYVTKGETIQIIYQADKAINDSLITICGFGGENISYTYSADRRTCTIEMLIKESMTIPQNTKVTFSINCKAMSTGKWMIDPITKTSDSSYLIYDSVSPIGEYILKDKY